MDKFWIEFLLSLWFSTLTANFLLCQVLLTRLRLMQSPPYPYEDLLNQYNNETNLIMCSYLPKYKQWNQTKGRKLWSLPNLSKVCKLIAVRNLCCMDRSFQLWFFGNH